MSNRLEQRVLAKIANYTVLGGLDAPGTRFTNRGASGAVTFTLPVANLNSKGDWYEFEVIADQSVRVQGATNGKLVAFGNAAANNVGFEIASSKVGGAFRVSCDGTQWVVSNVSGYGFCVNGSQVTPTLAQTATLIS